MAIDHTGIEDFERASVRKQDTGHFEHSLWTDDINVVNLCHFQCNFCLTITVLRLSFKKRACNVDIYTRVCFRTTSIVQRQNYCVVADFNICLDADNCCLITYAEKYIKSDSSYESYSKCCMGHSFIDSQFHVHDALSAFYKVV